jgi:hypothetical protein
MTTPIAVTTLTDPSGTDWVLDGSLGIWELTGKKGFHAGQYTHFRDISPAVDGGFWRGVRADIRDLFLPIFFRGTDRNAVLAQRRALIRAISPRNGECMITSSWPDGTSRSIMCRYVDGMEAGEQGPGEWGITALKYGLHFVADDPYMTSDLVTINWALLVSTRTELPVPGSDTLFESVTAPQLIISDISTTPINLNTDFESGVGNWGAIGGVLSQDLVFFKNGNAAAKIVPDGVTATVFFGSDQQAVVPLTAYRMSAWLANANARNVALSINWYDSSHVFIKTDTVSGSVVANTFTFFSGIAVSPFNAAFATLNPAMFGTPLVSDILWADDAQLAATGGQTFTNPGDVPSYPVWTLSGPFTDVTATNSTTGKTWKISYTAGVGEKLTLDTTPGVTSLVDLVGTNRWDRLVSGYQLWPVVSGDNKITATIGGATAASVATMTYQPRYESD